MTINQSGRRFLALLSMCGLAASIVMYVGTFSGEVARIGVWAFPLGFCALSFGIPIRLLEPESRSPIYFWTDFTKGMPKWVFPCLNAIWLISVAHIIWFAVHSHLGVPEIENGQYVLVTGTKGTEALTLPEFAALRIAEARMIAALIIFMYSVSLAYWLFRMPNKNAS